MKPVEKSKPKSASQQTWPGKYPSEERETADMYWKYLQKMGQTVPISKPSRAPTTEQMASFYSSASSYKPQRNYTHANPAYVKYATAEQAPHNTQAYLKTKEKRYTPEVSLQRRTRYDTELEDNAKARYSEEELGNYTEENPDDDGEEEEEQEEGAAYPDKDYEEQEADDEIDEESDASPQMPKLNRAAKKEALLRSQQRWRLEQQQNPRGVRYQQVPLGQNYLSAGRYYQNVAEHEACEPLSEDDFPPKVVSKRQPPADYNRWIQSRSSTDRRELVHGTRKARTKPEIECYGDPEFEKVRQCSRCGSLSKKAPVPVRHHCRFDERLSFPTKGPIGDDPEIRGRSCCRRCDPRQNFDSADPCEAGPSVYAMKPPRRTRDVKSPIYEGPEQPEKHAGNYVRPGLRFSRENSDAYPEKTRRSVQAQPTRLPSRYAEYSK